MGWIFEKIVEFVGQIIAVLLSFLAISVIDIYKLNGRETLNYFFNVFNGNPHSTGAANAGVFGQIYTLFMYTGLAIIFLGMLYNLFKAFFGPYTQAEPPTKTVIKAIIFALLCGASQSIVAIVFDITQIPFDAISSSISGGSALAAKFLGCADILSGGIDAFDIGSILGSAAGTFVFDVKIFSAIISIVLFVMLYKNMLMLVLEMAERYLMLGILTIIAPLCIACGAVKAVEDVFKNWLSWIINACVVMIINTFFLAIFIYNFNAIADVAYLCLWIAWLKTGQKIDEHMNSLGLKTAKTGGFGMDVMSAMIQGLPLATGVADKVTGSRLSSLRDWARRGFQGAPSQSGFGMWGFDPRKGERPDNLVRSATKGAASLAGMAGGKKLEEGINNALNKLDKANEKAAINASKAGNAMKEKVFGGMSTGHGSRTGMSHAELQEHLNGKREMPPKGTESYNNVAKDILDMKAGSDGSGKSLADELSNKGYSITGVKQDQNGDVMFSAEDKNGNKVVGTLTEGDAERNSGLIPMEGDDGAKRGMALTESEVEGKENPLNMGNMEDQPTEGRDIAALADSESMMENGAVVGVEDGKTVDGQDAEGFNGVNAETNGEQMGIEDGPTVESDGNKYALGEADENGIVTGTNINDPNDVKTFQQNEDGSLTDMDTGNNVGMASLPDKITDSQGNEFTVTGTDSQGNITATGADGSQHTFAQNGNELSELKDTNPDAEGGDIRSFSANGQEFSTTDKAGTDGVITATNKETGETAQFMQDASGNIYSANTDKDGAVSAGEKIADASSVSSSPASIYEGGMKYDLQNNADGTFTGTAKDGSTATFINTANGMKMIGNSASGSYTPTATDSNGRSFALEKGADGNYTGTATDGSGTTATFSAGADGSLTKTSESRQYDTEKGFTTQTTSLPDAQINTGKNGMESISFGSDGNGGFQHTYSNLENIGGNQYVGTAQDGSKARFSVDGNNVSMKQTFAYGTDGQKFQVDDSSIRNDGGTTVGVHNDNGAVSAMYADARTDNSSVTVKASNGEYVRTANSTMYNQLGQEDANGSYMMTRGQDGKQSLFEVERNSNGSVSTYDMSYGARFANFEVPSDDTTPTGIYASPSSMMTQGEGYNQKFADSVDYSYGKADGSNIMSTATNIAKGNQMYDIPEEDRGCATNYGRGDLLAQRYIRMADDPTGQNEQKLDMARCCFDENGYLDQSQPIYIQGRSDAVSTSEMFSSSSGSNGQTRLNQYVHGVNQDSGVMSSIELHDKAVECCQTRSFVNGVPTDLDFSSASLRSAASEGYSDNRMIASWDNGDKVMILPETAKTDGLQGVYAELPFNVPGSTGSSGRRVFLSAMPDTRMSTSINNYLNNNGYDPSTITKPIDVDTKSDDWKVLAREYDIPSKATNARIIPNSPGGPIIQYSAHTGEGVNRKLHNYIISANQMKGAESTPIMSRNNSSRVAYRHEVAKDSTFITKATKGNSMRIYKRKRDSSEERRKH